MCVHLSNGDLVLEGLSTSVVDGLQRREIGTLC